MMCASCEKSIDVKTPPYAHKLVLNGNSESFQPLRVSLSKSASIKDKSHPLDLSVSDAAMKLYVDGVYSETMVCDSAGEYKSVQDMIPGKQYTVKASEPTFDDISSSVTVPSVVSITDIKRVADARKDKDGNPKDALTISFTAFVIACAASGLAVCATFVFTKFNKLLTVAAGLLATTAA